MRAARSIITADLGPGITGGITMSEAGWLIVVAPGLCPAGRDEAVMAAHIGLDFVEAGLEVAPGITVCAMSHAARVAAVA